MNIYQPSFFDEAERLAKLTRLKDPLEALKRDIDFELLRPQLAAVFGQDRKSAGGRKAYDVVLMFKILILQRLYNLSDEQAEFQINDRQSFQRFLGLRLGSAVPDFSTVWLFRDALTRAGAIKPLFDTYGAVLEKQGVVTKAGTIVDASFVEVPKQRNTREENETIKQGGTPPAWEKQPHKLSQKDLDARWTKKNQETFYGYKNHVRADDDSKLITGYAVTDAAVHDSQVLPDLIGPANRGERLFADSACKSAKTDGMPAEPGITNYVHEKGVRNRPLHDLQKEFNRGKSQVRCQIEHIFGCVQNSMGGPELEYRPAAVPHGHRPEQSCLQHAALCPTGAPGPDRRPGVTAGPSLQPEIHPENPSSDAKSCLQPPKATLFAGEGGSSGGVTGQSGGYRLFKVPL